MAGNFWNVLFDTIFFWMARKYGLIMYICHRFAEFGMELAVRNTIYMRLFKYIVSVAALCLIAHFVSLAQNTVGFSPVGGVYADPFPVTMTCGNAALSIRYTLNGATPDGNSPLYSAPLMLDNNLKSQSDIYKILISPENEFFLPDTVEKCIVIRAAAFDNAGNRVGPVCTQSYFISALGCNLHNLPVVSICADSLTLFDYDTGIMVAGALCDPEDPEGTGNYAQHGEEWERAVNVEYYVDGNGVFNQVAGLRTHGGIRARRAQQKGLKIYARKEYGNKIFQGKIFEEIGLTEFKHLVLKPFRNAKTPAGVQDWLSNRIAREIGLPCVATRPVVLFLNGEYWGIYFLQEKTDDRYVEGHYGIDHDNVNIIASWGALESGTDDSYFDFYYWLYNADLTDSVQYCRFVDKINLPNFTDYLIYQLFIANGDWPINNVRCWQKADDNGPWNWIFYDGDWCFDDPYTDVYGNATYIGPEQWPTSEWSTLFYRKAFENQSFKNLFLTRYDFLNRTYFSYNRTKPFLDEIVRLLKDEIPAQAKRFDLPKNKSVWTRYCQDIDDFLARREEQFRLQTEQFFHLQDDKISSVVCYPNPLPFGEKLSLQIWADGVCAVWVSVYDLNGRFLFSQYVILQQGENQISLDMRNLQGVYLIQVGNHTKKVVVL